MAHSHHIQMPCCGWAPNAHLGSGKCPSPARHGFPLPGHQCTYVEPQSVKPAPEPKVGTAAYAVRRQLGTANIPSSPIPFLVYRCACGKPCSWCVGAEDQRVRNPFPNAKPEVRPKQCEMNPHQCAECFERDALERHAKGDPSVMVFECNPTRPQMSNITPTGEQFCRVKFGSALGDVFEEAVAKIRTTPDVPFCFEFNGVLFHVDKSTTVDALHKHWEVRRMGYT